MAPISRADLERLARNMHDWQRSAQELGDDYDEKGDPVGANHHWGQAEGYKASAEMVERELADKLKADPDPIVLDPAASAALIELHKNLGGKS